MLLNHIPHDHLFEDPEKNDYIQAAMVRSHPRHLNHRIPVYVLSIGLSCSVYYSKTT